MFCDPCRWTTESKWLKYTSIALTSSQREVVDPLAPHVKHFIWSYEHCPLNYPNVYPRFLSSQNIWDLKLNKPSTNLTLINKFFYLSIPSLERLLLSIRDTYIYIELKLSSTLVLHGGWGTWWWTILHGIINPWPQAPNSASIIRPRVKFLRTRKTSHFLLNYHLLK